MTNLKYFMNIFCRTVARKYNNVQINIYGIVTKKDTGKTNNVIEGWKSRLNKQINTRRPTFLVLHTCLNLETQYQDIL